MKSIKAIISITIICTLMYSCSKEEEKVVQSVAEVPDYDLGHLIIKMDEVNAGVDPATLVTDIELSNLTKGTVHPISPSLFTYIQSGGFSTLTTTFANGNINDQLQCCVNFSSAIVVNIGMRFENLPLDSVQTQSISSNNFCSGGSYQ